ncbi:eukaryotic translation initiation factor 3 subunit k [Dermatophagoides farinae]|uniref:Eukaryotic translation initiation factor 3 subunit K n=1 Tax=Dermatophagoides farinae TaxID=6954 RepID=A0A922KUF2_DERFA|nr:eukaryotic translation initiation factor 3 subunit K-like [Dermatophagoides farinae]KAH7644318.1 eukaryotic translation initiation factor 3 subunit k-like protein [Dermatophagoides farinae]KAH9493751.1 Eukaryotic translation initiation factor 3 subunit K [Dermatophagoides farinae]
MVGESKKDKIRDMLKGIELYNPNNLTILLQYLDEQCADNHYDLEANLTILRLYQFRMNTDFSEEELDKDVVKKVIIKILLKALTALPNTDFILCKSLIHPSLLEDEPEPDDELKHVLTLHQSLETCNFEEFWKVLRTVPAVYLNITGFEDSIRKFICYVVKITYQTMRKDLLGKILGGLDETQLKYWIKVNDWEEKEPEYVFISNQEELIKSKNIKEKIEFDNVARVVAAYAKQ